MIVIFGADICKFCKIQKKHLSNTFGSDSEEWVYVDVTKDKEGMEIALDIDVENIPAVVVIGNNNIEIKRADGLFPPDQIFSAIRGNSTDIPFSEREAKKVLKKNSISKLLSYDPKLAAGDIVKAYKYSGEHLKDFTVESCYAVAAVSKNISPTDLNEYQKCGGRKDIAWKINLVEDGDL